MQKAAVAWLTEHELQASDTEPNLQQQQIIQEGEHSKEVVLQYSDWLVTNCNVSIPDQLWSLPSMFSAA